MATVQLKETANKWESWQVPDALASTASLDTIIIQYLDGRRDPIPPGYWILLHIATGKVIVVSNAQYQAGIEPWVDDTLPPPP